MNDVVFAPNRVGEESLRLHAMFSGCRQGWVEDWTCKKTAKPADLYLFYFGKPTFQIIAAGICSGEIMEFENEGVDWTESDKYWEFQFKPLIKLTKTVHKDELTGTAPFQKWWQACPFHGRPKSLPPRVRSALLSLVAQRNPVIARRLRLSSYLSGKDADSTSTSNFYSVEEECPPARVQFACTRVIRNTARGNSLKRYYAGKCQVCRRSIKLPKDEGCYCEVHHLRPLGGDHEGKDSWHNMLVLCPTCHA